MPMSFYPMEMQTPSDVNGSIEMCKHLDSLGVGVGVRVRFGTVAGGQAATILASFRPTAVAAVTDVGPPRLIVAERQVPGLG